MFLTADGEADALLGNLTIRWNPAENWLEIKLPVPLAHLANSPRGRYRLSGPVEFAYRGDEVAAQASTGAVRYDITFDAGRGRWYLDASWRTISRPVPSLDDLRGRPLLAVDLNHGHLAAWVITPDGNPIGPPLTISLQLAGLPVSQRDGRLRDAISQLLRTAQVRDCAAIAVEDLSFAEARELGRERTGDRPSRGKRGRGYRRIVAGIPTGKFRGRLVQMAANAGFAVIAVDPAYTSRWGAQHWLAPLREQDPVTTTGHHAAAVVIGRRAQGHTARRRGRRDRRRPADRSSESCPPSATGPQRDQKRQAPRGPAAATTVAEDRDGRPSTPARPGDPRPFGAAR